MKKTIAELLQMHVSLKEEGDIIESKIERFTALLDNQSEMALHGLTKEKIENELTVAARKLSELQGKMKMFWFFISEVL